MKIKLTSVYKLLNKSWRQRPATLLSAIRARMVAWRKEKSVVRVDKPMRLDRARALGYRAKPGYVVLRVRVRRGGFSKPRPRSGRRPKAIGVVRHKVNLTTKEEAIQRGLKRYPNLKPLGAYPLASDSIYKWFEVIAVDPSHPAVKLN